MPLSIGRRTGRAPLWITGAFAAAFSAAPRSRTLVPAIGPDVIGNALEHPKHLRPYRDGGEKQAQRGQRDRFFQNRPDHDCTLRSRNEQRTIVPFLFTVKHEGFPSSVAGDPG
jgi:hypothetical protein